MLYDVFLMKHPSLKVASSDVFCTCDNVRSTSNHGAVARSPAQESRQHSSDGDRENLTHEARKLQNMLLLLFSFFGGEGR